MRKYSLYKKTEVNGRTKWESVSDVCLPKQEAVKFFQRRLLDSALGASIEGELELRPVRENDKMRVGR